jgi:hypothetical protein
MGISHWPKSRALVILAFAVSLGAFGCSKPVGSVKGKVYYKKTALKGGRVIFLKADGQTESSEIQEDGSYNIDKITPVGPVKIAVVTSGLKPNPRGGRRNPAPADAEHPPNKESDPTEMLKRYIPIPLNYEKPETSNKEYTVTPGSQDYDIQLD